MARKQTLILAAASIAIILANVHLPLVTKEPNIDSLPYSKNWYDLANSNNLDKTINYKIWSLKLGISNIQPKDWSFLSLDMGDKKYRQCHRQENSLLMDLYNLLARLLIVISFGAWGLGGYLSVIERYLKRIPKDFLIFLYVIFGLLSLVLISSAFLSTFAFAYPISNSRCLL